jgi:MoxR-like ATPase
VTRDPDIERAIREECAVMSEIRAEMARVLVGQAELVDGLLTGLLADGHVLLEGLPGLAKSLAAASLAQAIGGSFRRLQFTPDLLPSDLLGTHVYDPRSGEWTVREGPIFANFVLADEINRAPAKVQSALLEAMQERQVSLAGDTRKLPSPFLVLATQNPIEQEGTYPLPEAQVDRFLLKVVVGYPSAAEEKEVVQRMARHAGRPSVRQVATPEMVLAARSVVDRVHVDPRIIDYVVALAGATRNPAAHGLPEWRLLVRYGASPRASIALVLAARARAILDGRGFVTPHEIKRVALPVLRHRVLMTYEAEAEGQGPDDFLGRVLDTVPVP